MSLTDRIPELQSAPSNEPSDLTLKELAEYNPARRNVIIYERQISDLTKVRDHLQAKYDLLLDRLDTELVYRVSYARLKRGKTEAIVQLFVSTGFTGIGALGMGIFPRTGVGNEATLFWVSTTVAVIGVFLGLVIRPITLCLYYLWPKLCEQQPKDG